MDRLLRLVPWPHGAGSENPTAAARLDEPRLVAGLRAREPWAASALVERHGPHVRRVLLRVMGDDSEQADLAQEVFVQAWRSIDGLEDAAALKAWLTRVAVFVARAALRRRRRRRWLSFWADPPERAVPWAGADLRDAAQAVYAIFDRMPEDERLPFALRALDGASLEEAAAACGMSLATTRRRMARAERRFFKLARDYAALAPWLREGRRPEASAPTGEGEP